MIEIFKKNLIQFHKLFFDIFFPRRCVVCGKYNTILCFECAKEIEYIKTPICLRCGKITKYGEFCSKCRSHFSLDGIIYAAIYDNAPIKELLHHLKYNQITEPAELLGDIISDGVSMLPFDRKKLAVVPVPLYIKREQQRGYNQSELIARRLSTRLGLPGGCALVRIKNTSTQVGLRKEERMKNVMGAFCCTDKDLIRGKIVLLVDDVVTTGATLNECGKVLKEAGAKKVIGVTVAKRIN